MFSESHCHLGDMSREDLERAEKAGFKVLLTAGIDLPSSELAVETARRHPIAYASVGVHPWYADEYSEAVEARFRELAGEEVCVAISEVGLDFVGRMTHDWVREDRYIDPKVQRRTLEAQLALARELGMPVVVHDRAPGMEILGILEKSGVGGVAIHGFSKDTEYAQRCVDNGFYLSLGLRPLRAGEPRLLEAVKAIPLEHILTETDSREPEGVKEVCRRVAELKGLSMEEVGRVATENLVRLLGL